MRREHADIASLFGLPADFYKSQDWGEYSDPARVEEFVYAYERSRHTSVWSDTGLAELIWDSFARLWFQDNAVPASAEAAIERFVGRWHRRLGVRRYLQMMTTIQETPGDRYPECQWLRVRWSLITGDTLDALRAFNFLALLEDPRTTREGGPPVLPEMI